MGRRRNNGAAASAATTNATNAEAGQPANRKKISENNLAFVLISIVVMHFICHILRVFMAIYSVYLISDTLDCLERGVAFSPPLWSMCSDCVASLLLMVNFSGNFLIYCSALKSFRGKLKQIWQTSSQKTNGTRRQSRQQVRETDGGSAKSRNSITIANGATLATTVTTIPEGSGQDNAETSL